MQDKPYWRRGWGGDTVVSWEEAVQETTFLPAHSLNDLQCVWTNHSHLSGPITPPRTSYRFFFFFFKTSSYQL